MYDFSTMDKRLIVFGYLFRVANRLQNRMDTQIRELTAKQWFVIMAIGLFDEPPTLKQLAAVCDSSHQNTKQLIVKLREKGFVRIDNDCRDSRAMRISTTEKCEQWDRENEKESLSFVNEMFKGFSPEETEALRSSLFKLFDNLENVGGNFDE